MIDGLTRFFTPSNKRKSRVSLNAFAGELPSFTNIKSRAIGKSKTAQQQSKSQQAASKLIKKSRKLQANKAAAGRKKNNGPPGSGQLKGLFDGLSHLFTAQGERKRSMPVYNPLKIRKITKHELFQKYDFPGDLSPPRGIITDQKLLDTETLDLLGAGPGRGRGVGAAVDIEATPSAFKRGRGRPVGSGGGVAVDSSPVGRGRGRGRGRPAGKLFV